MDEQAIHHAEWARGSLMKNLHKGLDDLDRKIISEFQKDGRKSSKDLARKFKVSDGTIRFRTNRLMKQNTLRVTASINPFSFSSDGIIAYVGMELEKTNPHDHDEEDLPAQGSGLRVQRQRKI